RLHAQVGGEEREQVLLGDEAQVEEEALQPLAPLLLEPLHLAQVVLGDAALLDQELLERAVRELHGTHRAYSRVFRAASAGFASRAEMPRRRHLLPSARRRRARRQS